MTPGTCLCSVFKGCCTSLLNKSEKLKIEKWALCPPKQREENCSPYHLFQLSIEGRVDLKTQATENNFSLIVNIAILEIMWSFSNSEDTCVRKIGRKQGEFLLFLSNVDKPLSLSFGFLWKDRCRYDATEAICVVMRVMTETGLSKNTQKLFRQRMQFRPGISCREKTWVQRSLCRATLRETGIEQIQKKNSGHFWTVLVLNKYSTLTTKQRFLPDSKFSDKGLPFWNTCFYVERCKGN